MRRQGSHLIGPKVHLELDLLGVLVIHGLDVANVGLNHIDAVRRLLDAGQQPLHLMNHQVLQLPHGRCRLLGARRVTMFG